ncbi:MAG: hypothetical protein WBA93_20725 [Microcoleaceae cyanobacterium]
MIDQIIIPKRKPERLLVTEGDKLLGILTRNDLVKLERGNQLG